MPRATVIPTTVNARGSTRPRDSSRTDPEPTLPARTTYTNSPMMHPEDEANSDAPLVPRIRTPNRPTIADGGDADSIRREIRELRSRVDDLEANLNERGDR